MSSGKTLKRILKRNLLEMLGSVFLSTFTSPKFEQVLTYWQSVAKDAVPSVAEFDLIQIPAALPDITFWEMSEDGRVVCRMAGTAVTARMKSDLTGVDLTQVMPPSKGMDIVEDLRTILAHPCGLFQVVRNRHVTGKIALLETLILPLRADPGGLPKFIAVNHMIETVRYDSEEPAGTLELMRSIDEHRFIDLGWGVPTVQNPNHKST